MMIRTLFLILAFAGILCGQPLPSGDPSIDIIQANGVPVRVRLPGFSVDDSGVGRPILIPSAARGTTVPSSCITGNLFVKTTATENLFYCDSSGTYQQISSSGSGTVDIQAPSEGAEVVVSEVTASPQQRGVVAGVGMLVQQTSTSLVINPNPATYKQWSSGLGAPTSPCEPGAETYLDETGGDNYDCGTSGWVLRTSLTTATTNETSSGTLSTKAVTPASLSGSVFGETAVEILVTADFTTDTSTGDGKYYFIVPDKITGMVLSSVKAGVVQAGTTGSTTVQIARCAAMTSGNMCSGTVVDMLSTVATIESGENSSVDATAQPVINTSNDDVTANQVLRVDVDSVSTTAAKGLILVLGFRK